MNRLYRIVRRLILYALVLVLLLFGLPRLITELFSKPRTFSVASVPHARVAIVFGAGLRRDGSPTLVLRDRVETASQLYFSGKVEKLLMSGDNTTLDYNEPQAMHDFAVELGVPPEDIVLDYAGRRTYDTCYRAQHIFGLDSAILVTQGFHIPRAVFLCNSLGLEAYGVPADQNYYLKRSRLIWFGRETIATTAAMLDLWLLRPQPVLGVPEPIFPPQDSAQRL